MIKLITVFAKQRTNLSTELTAATFFASLDLRREEIATFKEG